MIDDTPLHALADGRLPPEQAAALRARLTPAQQAQLAQWQAQREQLRALHADWEYAPLPAAQQAGAARLQALLDGRQQGWRWGGMAAGWVLAFGLGWWGHGQAPRQQPLLAAAAPVLSVGAQFAQQAAVAHAVYQPEQRHPVEVAAAQQDHLVQWLSKRLGRPLKAPALQAEGFELVGGRLLPGVSGGDGGTRAQFMYQNAAGVRITLYLGALGDAGAETAFRFHTQGQVQAFYWVDQGFGYALSGELPRAELLALAHAAYRQIHPDAPGPASRPAPVA